MRGLLALRVLFALVIVTACIVDSPDAGAQVERVSARNGWWHDPLTWIPGGVPTLDDVAIVQAGHTVHVRAPAAARAVVNYGVLDHPQGHITSDRRVTILLMIGAIDSLVNYGAIYGYNAPDGATDRNEIVPTSVLLTVTGDPMSLSPTGQIINHGLIRAGDAYVRYWSGGPVVDSGGMVVARGRPRFWSSWPGATSVSNPDIRLENTGEIAGGRGLGAADLAPGGSVIIGLSPFGRDVDAPYCPCREILTPGLIQGGAFAALGGSTVLVASNALRPGVSGGTIDGDGGSILAGEGVTTGFMSCAVADNITFSGPGTWLDGGFRETMIGWDPFTTAADAISLRDLDQDAVFARRATAPLLDQDGSRVEVISSVVDLQDNPAGTVVLHAEDGLMLPADIVVAAGALFLDMGVQLRDITDPSVDPWPWAPSGEGEGLAAAAAGPREGIIEPALAVQPAGTPPDTTLTIPGHGMGSPGDTVAMWYHVLTNGRLAGDIEVMASDSLGYYIPNGFQVTVNDTFPISTVEFDVVVPPWASFGTVDRIDIHATYVDSPSVHFDLTDRLYVVPTINVIADFPIDGFFDPGSEPFDGVIELLVRNEGRTGASLDLSVWDTEGWYLYPEFTHCWLPARAETVLCVGFDIPGWAQSGDVDTVYMRAQEATRAPNRDEVRVEVDYDTQTGVVDPDGVRLAVLRQNAPNPFNPRTEIRFALPQAGIVSLGIYDVGGRLVRSLISDRMMPRGDHMAVWDGRNEGGRCVASGVYFCRLATQHATVTRKMALIR